MKKRPAQKSVEMVECLDQLDAHCHTLQTLAQLLALCDEVSTVVVDARMVGGTGSLILRELDELRQCRSRIEKGMGR